MSKKNIFILSLIALAVGILAYLYFREIKIKSVSYQNNQFDIKTNSIFYPSVKAKSIGEQKFSLGNYTVIVAPSGTSALIAIKKGNTLVNSYDYSKFTLTETGLNIQGT